MIKYEYLSGNMKEELDQREHFSKEFVNDVLRKVSNIIEAEVPDLKIKARIERKINEARKEEESRRFE